jgi:hypothetical protein
MSTDIWRAEDFRVLDENRRMVATACDADHAEQIVREHMRAEGHRLMAALTPKGPAAERGSASGVLHEVAS